MAVTEFEYALNDFQNWATAQNPEFGQQVAAVIGNTYVSQLGDVTQNAAVNTADKLSSLVASLGNTYLNAVGTYYTAKQKVADLKLLSKGSAVTQIANAAGGAISIPPTNLLLIGGLGLVAVLMLSRR